MLWALQCHLALHWRNYMINAYRLKYLPATDNNSARFSVTRIDDGKGYKVSYDYAANNPLKHAIHDAFGEDVANIEFIGDLNASGTEKLYAVSH
jgi:hypothetical protein